MRSGQKNSEANLKEFLLVKKWDNLIINKQWTNKCNRLKYTKYFKIHVFIIILNKVLLRMLGS